MTRGNVVREGVVLLGTAGTAGVLFWMSLYVIGPFALIPGAAVLFIALVVFRRRMTSPRLLVECTAFACLLAAQGSLLSAVVMEVLPNLVPHLV